MISPLLSSTIVSGGPIHIPRSGCTGISGAVSIGCRSSKVIFRTTYKSIYFYFVGYIINTFEINSCSRGASLCVVGTRVSSKVVACTTTSGSKFVPRRSRPYFPLLIYIIFVLAPKTNSTRAGNTGTINIKTSSVCSFKGSDTSKNIISICRRVSHFISPFYFICNSLKLLQQFLMLQ